MNVPRFNDLKNIKKVPDMSSISIDPGNPNIPVQMQQRNEQTSYPQQGQNPFEVSQFQNVNLPDMPIGQPVGLAESLLNDDEVPDDIKEKFWFIFHKDNVLTFLDEDRKKNKLLNFDICKIDILNTMPYYGYDFSLELMFNLLRNVYETKLDRALGFKGGNQKNERLVLQSQFTEQRQISENGDNSMIKEGFFKRLLSRR